VAIQQGRGSSDLPGRPIYGLFADLFKALPGSSRRARQSSFRQDRQNPTPQDKKHVNQDGVIGAGQMGSVSHMFVHGDHDVVWLMESIRVALDKALEKIRGDMDRQIKRTMIEEEDKAAALTVSPQPRG